MVAMVPGGSGNSRANRRRVCPKPHEPARIGPIAARGTPDGAPTLGPSNRRTTMRGFGGLAVAGLVGLVAVVATPASAQGGAAPAAVVDTVKARAVRWVIAARVRLRAAPAADAAVLGGVAVNTPLHLQATV